VTPLIAVAILLQVAAGLWAIVLAFRSKDVQVRLLALLLVTVSLGHVASILGTIEAGVTIRAFRVEDVTMLGTALAVLLTVALFYRVAARHRQVEREFGVEKAYLTELFESSPEAIVMLDNDGKVLRINQPFTALFGFSDAEILGREIDELVSSPEYRAEARDITRRITAGEKISLETVRQKKNGLLVEVAIIGAPVRTAGGQIAVFGIYRDVTSRRRLERELLRLQKAVATTQLGVTITDLSGRIVYSNRAEAEMHGWTADELIGKDVRVFSAEPSASLPLNPEELQRVSSWRRETVNRRKDGSIFPVQLMSDLVRDADGEPIGIVTTCEDIRRRKDAEKALRASEERYALAARGANDGLWDWEIASDTAYYSERWKSILGYGESSFPGRIDSWLKRIHPEDVERVQAELDAHFRGETEQFENEHRVRHKDGSYRWVLIRGLAVRDAGGQPQRMAGSLTDIASRKRVEEQLAKDALYDPLTSLPNRAFFTNLLERSVRRGRRRQDYRFAVLFLDLDRFKLVNDSLGHDTGDQLLIGVSDRLERCLRPGDVVARLAGDEFCILVDAIKDANDAIRVAERVQEELKTPFMLGGHRVFASASIGIATSQDYTDGPEHLLRDADTAMYRAKTRGRARFEIFDKAMHERAMQVLELEGDLRTALEQEQFRLVYLPVVSLETKKIIGFEALVRWEHPTRGLIPPAEFVPVAEETGVIIPLGIWVLREACAQMAKWKQQIPAHDDLTMSVNLSAKQLQQADLVFQVSDVLRETGVEPNRLKLEVTETVLMDDPEYSTSVVQKLNDLGIQVQIDDFGTGYSSLSYLNRLHIDTLKIDRSFISSLGSPGERAVIVHAIIRLARELGINVIAEGVETSEQLQSLRSLECAHGQGFLFSQPVGGDAAGDLLASLPSDG
jgi:diguanylate cyclase (GGDEF)-like protein/PAS domain S-box-containing protein